MTAVRDSAAGSVLTLTTALTNVAGPRSHAGARSTLKRRFDILASASALLSLLPVVPLLAILIKCGSPGKVWVLQDSLRRDL